jgi:hypothetical protein
MERKHVLIGEENPRAALFVFAREAKPTAAIQRELRMDCFFVAALLAMTRSDVNSKKAARRRPGIR